MYDAIYLGAQRLETRQGRKVIVVVTDGGDTISKVDVHKALEAAQLADAVIYPIVVMPITNDAGRNIGGENALEFMAKGTGGRTFMPSRRRRNSTRPSPTSSPNCAPSTCSAIYPQNVPLTKDRFHRLEVRVMRPDLRVSARNGYYGEVEGGGAGGSSEDRISVSPDRQPKPSKKKR